MALGSRIWGSGARIEASRGPNWQLWGYRVIKLKWEKVKAWYSLMPILSDLNFFFFERTIIDVFCIKISEV